MQTLQSKAILNQWTQPKMFGAPQSTNAKTLKWQNGQITQHQKVAINFWQMVKANVFKIKWRH